MAFISKSLRSSLLVPNFRFLDSRVSSLPFSSTFRGISSNFPRKIPSFPPSQTPLPNFPKPKKPLDVFFKESVGLIEKSEEIETTNDYYDSNSHKSIEMCKKLQALEEKVRSLKKVSIKSLEAKQNRLYSVFDESSSKKSDVRLVRFEELSTEMSSFLGVLYKEGYLVNGNFVKEGRLDLSCLVSAYSQDYLKFAAERFGEEHQEIAKWLSGGDLKKIALFGCPSVEKKAVLAAKGLRSFFSIHEESVCQACKLKNSCKFPNKRVTKNRNLVAADALRLLTIYGLELVPRQLVLNEEIKISVNKLLKQVVNLSKSKNGAVSTILSCF